MNKKPLKLFINENKYAIIFLYCLTFATYGIKLFFYSISIDTEIMINNPIELLNSWYAIGRFGLCFIKIAFGLIPINIVLTNCMTVIIIPIAIITWTYVFYEINKAKKSQLVNFIFGAIVITSPLLAEQFNFTLQSFEIIFALILEGIALILINRWILSKKIINLIIAIPLLVISFSSYQLFLMLFIMGCVISYILIFQDESKKDNAKTYITTIVKYMMIFIFTYLLYLVISKVIQKVFNISHIEYLDNMITWGNEPILKTIARLGYFILSNLLGRGILYQPFFLVIALAFVVYSIKLYMKKQISFIWYVIPSVFLVATPYLIAILTGKGIPARADFGVSILLGFLILFLIQNLESKRKILIGFSIAVIVVQFTITLTLFLNDYKRYNEDKKLAIEISDIIIGNYDSNKPVVFLGSYNHNNKKIIKGETMGNSVFSWDHETLQGVNYRVHGFLNTLGISFVGPALKDIEEAKQYSEDLESYPNDNYIKEFEHFIIVKL